VGVTVIVSTSVVVSAKGAKPSQFASERTSNVLFRRELRDVVREVNHAFLDRRF
jgi:hypothetical protein